MNFDFTIENKLSPEYILSRISEESIMYFYLGINLNKRGLFRSPLRRDKNPTCSIFRNNKGKLIFKDFATGQYLDCWNIVMTIHNCSYRDAIKIVANDFGIIKNKSLIKNKGKIDTSIPKIDEKEFSKIQVEIQDFSELELKWWLKFGITKEILNKFNVFSCKHVFLNDNLIASSQQHCPIFGYYGKKYQGNELWKIYFPKRKEYRFIGNYPSKKLQGYDQLPKSGKICIITKSQKDVMTLYSLGIPACAPNSETVIPSDTIIEDLKKRFTYIIVLWDNDYTGITFLNKFKRKYPELIYTWLPRDSGAKDISDFYKVYGKKKTQALIKEFILWLKTNRKNWI